MLVSITLLLKQACHSLILYHASTVLHHHHPHYLHFMHMYACFGWGRAGLRLHSTTASSKSKKQPLSSTGLIYSQASEPHDNHRSLLIIS